MDKLLTFADRQAFREWLGKYGTESDGVWLLFGKKGKFVTLSAGEALEEALCHGWIDGQIQSLDDNTYNKGQNFYCDINIKKSFAVEADSLVAILFT